MADIDVWVDQQVSGRLTHRAQQHVFAYAMDATEALSLTMPLRTESYAIRRCTLFFR